MQSLAALGLSGSVCPNWLRNAGEPRGRLALGPPHSPFCEERACGGELADTPGSVGAAPKCNAGDHSSRAYVAVSLKRSTRRWGASSSSLLLDLAPGGVYLASQVTLAAGALLPHRFTLTASSPRDEGVAVCFLWHFPAGYPGWLLATTLL